ncbi:MAG: hypothetical protein FWE22_06430 [Firmicutes bacterium]|nr:hypothetical protein [Bacillota bacterium]
MLKKLIEWANNNKQLFESKGIKTEKIFSNEYNVYVDHETKNCIGRIIFNAEGYVDIEIIEIESEVKIMYAHYAFQSDFFEDLIDSYIRILIDSTNQLHSKYHDMPVKTDTKT